MINLQDYTPKIRESLKRRGAACVYVISTGALTRVGYAMDIALAVDRLRRSATTQIHLESLVWVPDRRIAATVVTLMQHRMKDLPQINGWATIDPFNADFELKLVLQASYPDISTATHDEIMAEWGRIREAV